MNYLDLIPRELFENIIYFLSEADIYNLYLSKNIKNVADYDEIAAYDELTKKILDCNKNNTYLNISNGQILAYHQIDTKSLKCSNKYNICWFRDRYTKKEIKKLRKV